MKSSTSGSVEFVGMSLDRPTRFIRLLQTHSLRIVSGTNVDLPIRRTKLII